MTGTNAACSMSKRQRLMEYLKNHFRYFTENSWNQSTSYARNVKIYDLTMDAATRSRACDLLEVPEAFDEIHELIREFEQKHDWQWQVGFNGRSDGYLVLYRGGREKSGYTTKCDRCGRLTWYETEQPCHVERCKGTLKKLPEDHYRIFTYPGKGVDDDADFSEWSMEELEDRARLVRKFDKLCDACVESFINFAKTHAVEEREILVPKTVRVAVERS
jgi:hypothetical protein